MTMFKEPDTARHRQAAVGGHGGVDMERSEAALGDTAKDRRLHRLPAGGSRRAHALTPDDLRELVDAVRSQQGVGALVVIVGLTEIAERLVAALRQAGSLAGVAGIYAVMKQDAAASYLGVPVRPLCALQDVRPDVLVVAGDRDKEDLLVGALPYIQGCPRVILTGYSHFAFRDATFEAIRTTLRVPSLANGYPHSLVHLYECLRNAARLRLSGVVVELGVFRGGTTMFLSKAAEALGADWKVIGFDTFAGFPPRRSALDMYEHADLQANDVDGVRAYLRGRNVELVPGDITETCQRLRSERVVLSFFDTDNYTPATAALAIVREQTVVGGAIVFDHFTGTDHYKHTLGERLAAKTLSEDARYFNLHGTGVFLRQR